MEAPPGSVSSLSHSRQSVGKTTANKVPISSEREEGVNALSLPGREKTSLAFERRVCTGAGWLPQGGHKDRPYNLEQTLVLLLLALDAMPRPRHRLQTFDLDLFLAGHTEAVGAILEAFQSFVD